MRRKKKYMDRQNTTGEEHILACLSPSPSNAKIIKTAAQMAKAFGGKLTAMYVKTPASETLSRENRDRLERHIRLAEELGAEIITVYGEDVAQQIMEFARLSGVTKIVLGRSYIPGGRLLHRQTLTDQIIKAAPGLDIHIIPDTETRGSKRFYGLFSPLRLPSLKQWVWMAVILFLSTAMGFAFHTLKFTEANTITVYMLGVLITALVTKNYICSGVFSLASVLLFNFFFTAPRLSFIAYESGYPVTFAIMLIASLIMGTLANKVATNARISANTAYRTNIMLETNQLLQKTDREEAVVDIMAQQLGKLLARTVVVYPLCGEKMGEPKLFLGRNVSSSALLSDNEKAIAQDVFQDHGRGGRGSDRMKEAVGTYVLVKTDDTVFCLVGIEIGNRSIDPFEESIMMSILRESALTMGNLRNVREKEEIALLAKNEQLRANLLRAISHDLRTPLTSILGNTENLLANFENIDDETRRRLLMDVNEDAEWLIALVENLLSVSRINEGRMNIHISAQLVDEVVTEALRHVNRKAQEHHIVTDFGEELLLANMDARLISQVMINLVDNAIKYTPPGSLITISTKDIGSHVEIRVADNGPGIPDEQKNEVFRMFYTGMNPVVDCRRSLGLGLSLCESIVNAHGGELTLTDNQPHGCIFTFTLEKSEVDLGES